MPESINGDTYYRTSEVCKTVGISRNTLFRWLKEGGVSEVEHRDYRGWRLFTQAQIDTLKKKTGQINTIYLRKQTKETSSFGHSQVGSATEYPGARSSHED